MPLQHIHSCACCTEAQQVVDRDVGHQRRCAGWQWFWWLPIAVPGAFVVAVRQAVVKVATSALPTGTLAAA